MTQFQDDVMLQLSERCDWSGIDKRAYCNMSGISLLTAIVARKNELSKLQNLTDMQVLSLLESQ